MQTIELDATNWTTALDLYDALLAALGAPEWHGRNLNALTDSMIWGGINEVEPPYTIQIRGTAGLSKDVLDEIELAKRALSEARAQYRAVRGRDREGRLETGV